MDKELQRNINDWCMNVLDKASHEFIEGSYNNCGRLRSCTAWVYETDTYYILRSYNTMYVAIIDKRTRQCYDLLRYVYGYTSTSAQHVSKFWHDYGNTKIYRYTYREI